MLVRVVTLRFDPRLDGFDEAPLRELCRSADVLSATGHFFVREEVPYWSVLVTCAVPASDGEPAAPAGGVARREGPGYREILRQEDWPLFNALRDWRAGVAAKEGVPPYIVVPNDVLAWIARERPRTLSALGQIRGMGAARIKRHGRALLAAMGVAATQDEAVGADAAATGASGTEAAVPGEGEGGGDASP